MKGLKRPFYLQGKCEGCLTLEPLRDRTVLSISCKKREEGVYKGVLYGKKGRISVGTLLPNDEMLQLRCILPTAQLEEAGEIERGEAILSFSASERTEYLPGWRKEPTPERLFEDPVLIKAARKLNDAWTRQENGVLFLALPWKGEFPMLPLFCFARIMNLEGNLYVVFALDAHGMPIATKW